MIFEGTIIITDPCYFSRKEDWNSEDGFDSIENLINPSLGFSDYIWIPTGFGDTSGIVLNDNEENLGSFSVDSGTYGVFYLSEIESYNPGMIKYFKDHPKLGTIIENYTGNIKIIKKQTRSCKINCLKGSNFIAEL